VAHSPDDPGAPAPLDAAAGPAAPPPRPRAPAGIGPYRVLRELARGGGATVFEVEDPRSGRRVALKRLDQRMGARLDHEYRALRRLDHPGVVRVYELGQDLEGRPWLTLELLEGVPAQVRAKASGRPGDPARTAEVTRIAHQIALVLAHLHGRGVVHRDLKSSNVLVLRDGRVKLLDFGTALTGDSAGGGEFVGTIAYASPEQLRGQPVDGRSDLYALGVLLFRLLTGRRPFEADGPEGVAKKHLEEPAPLASAWAPGLPDGLVRVVDALLAKRPEGRPADARAAAAALAPWVGSGLAGGGPGGGDSALPLIGRDAVMDALLSGIGGGGSRLLLLDAPVGGGAGRVLRDLGAAAQGRGWTVAVEGGGQGRGQGGLDEAVRSLARFEPDGGRAALSQLAAARQAARAPEAALAAIVGVIERAAERGPTLLLMRELDRSPPVALAALARAFDRVDRGGGALRVVARQGPGPPAEGLDALRPVRVPMPPLQVAEMARLVGAALGQAAPPPGLVARVHESAGGQPGLALELLRGMQREGLLQARSDGSGAWDDLSGGRVPVPPAVDAALGPVVDALGAAELAVLQVAAVAAGVPIDLRATAAGAELPPEDAAAALAALSAAGLLTSAAGRFSLGTGALGELVRGRTRPHRVQVLRGRLVGALPPDPPSAATARLRLLAGDLAGAVSDALRWAPAEVRGGRATEALPLLLRVSGAAAGAPVALRARLDLLLVHTLARVDRDDPRADAALARVGEDLGHPARWDGPADLAVAALELELAEAVLLRRRGDSAAARARRARLAARLRGAAPEPLRLELALEVALAAEEEGDLAPLRAAWEEVQALAAAAGDPALGARARVGLGRVALARGQLRSAEAALGGAGADPEAAWHAAAALAELLRASGRVSGAASALAGPLRLARQRPRPFPHAVLLLELAEVHLASGQLGLVRELLQEAESLDIVKSHPALHVRSLRLRGELLLSAGEPEDAKATLEAAVEAAGALGRPVDAERSRAKLGLVLSRLGEVGAAEAATRRAIEALSGLDQRLALAEAAALRAEALAGHQDPRHSRALVGAWADEEPLWPVRLRFALAELLHARAGGAPAARSLARRRLEDVMREIWSMPDGSPPAAMRVHPWVVDVVSQPD